jgi:uncharacterized membrane protein YraQ (UPF0718 family)
MLKNFLTKMVVGASLALIFLAYAGVATAAVPNCPSGEAYSPSTGRCDPVKDPKQCSAGVSSTDPTKCNNPATNCSSNNAKTCLKKNPIIKDLNTIITALSAAVGLLVIGVIIVGGIQYTLAGDNATATGAAKQRIINGLIALLAYIFLFGFLQWITPGGI